MPLSGLLLLVAGGALAADAPAANAPAANVIRLDGQSFTLPAGFTIELAVPPALVPRPITAAFDDEGRLYVSEASGTNAPVPEQLQERPHRVLRLVDTNGDGVFDKSTVFADKLMLPQGTMWHGGSLYVGAPPSIWKLTDTDGDGVADQRVEWWQGKTLTGCANDVHGPYLGPDGWFYWTKGAFAQQTHEVHGKPFVTKASHIYRSLPDGSRFEPVMTGGMDNPVDVAFNSAGDAFLSNTFIVHPSGGQRDGIVHAVHGGLYGKVHDVLNGHIWTGPQPLPPLVHLGPAAACGLHCHSGFGLGEAYRDNLFACQFNLRQVSRHILSPKGSTYESKDEPFLVSDNVDFHPTDVLEDADGSLLVVNTGGWYKLCCPTSQFHKPDITGGIYRVRKTNAPRGANLAGDSDPRGLKLNWLHMSLAEAVPLLVDPRPAVRQRATEMLRNGGKEALPYLRAILEGALPRPADQRRAAVWTLARMDDKDARAMVRNALSDTDASVRETALHGVSLWRDREAVEAATKILGRGAHRERRLAAETLGRSGDAAAVQDLVQASRVPSDRFHEHAICYALIELNTPGAPELRLLGAFREPPRTHGIVLTALDQMPGKNLTFSHVQRRLGGKDAALEEALLWIMDRHPEWGDDLEFYLAREVRTSTGVETRLPQLIARYARSAKVQAMIVEQIRQQPPNLGRKRMLLTVMASSSPREVPQEWLEVLEEIIGRGEVDFMPDAIAAARSPGLSRVAGERLANVLLAAAANEGYPARVRLSALAAVAPARREISEALFALLERNLLPAADAADRAAALDALTQAKLNAGQLAALTAVVAKCGPLEIDRMLEPFAGGSEEKVGLALIESLAASPLVETLRIDQLRPRLAKYPASVQAAAEKLYARINADAARERQRLEELLAGLPPGDVRRGQAVFHSAKALCSGCHAIGYAGGRLGPDLTKIGSIRTERDLLESIVFPSASLVRSYEPVQIETVDGRQHSGLVRQETSQELTLITGLDPSGTHRTLQIARNQIDAILPGKISLMPAGIDRVLTQAELADLVAYLKSCK